MRKSLWIVLAVMVLAVSAPNAHADAVYAISFSGAGAPTVVGSDLLDFNSTLGEFTTPSIEISYLGADITLTNNGLTGVSPTDSFEWLTPGGGSIFVITDNTLTGEAIYNAGCPVIPPSPSGCPEGGGVVSLSLVTAPEPSSVALMLLGVGLVFVMRKRISRGHQLAA